MCRPWLVVTFLAALWLVGCEQESPDPTAIPTTAAPIMASSPTIDPLLPTNDPLSGMAVGINNPTQAGLAAEGQPDVELPTLTPRPTEATLPMVITAADGLALRATLHSAPTRPAPIVLLLHEEGYDQSSWNPLATRLQEAGYAVLTVDLRGHGETGGRSDWSLAVSDVEAVLRLLGQLPGIDPARLIIVGSSISANLALHGCAGLVNCAGAVLLSPGLDYRGITTADAMTRLGTRSVLIVASENDENNPADSVALDSAAAGNHQLVIYPAAGHGMGMFTVEPGLLDTIVNWIVTQVPIS